MIDMTVKEIMTTDVKTVPEHWNLSQLAEFFVAENVSGAPVKSDTGEVVGVVSMTDIVRHENLPVTETPSHDVHEYYMAALGRQYAVEEIRGFHIDSDTEVTVRDLMTPMVFQVEQDASVQQVADMMIRGNIHRVLVTSGKQIVGIVAALDMLKVIRDL